MSHIFAAKCTCPFCGVQSLYVTRARQAPLRRVRSNPQLPKNSSRSGVEKTNLEGAMALQWVILACVVAVEAAIAVFLTLPSPRLLKKRIVSMTSILLQPLTGIVPFAGFQLLDLYWKNEHRLMCSSDVCTAAERDRYEKAIFKAQRNVILCILAILLYWCMYQVCKYYKEMLQLEEEEKHRKKL